MDRGIKLKELERWRLVLPHTDLMILLVACRIPLKKGKSIREAMKEKGVLHEYLQQHRYHDPAYKFFSSFSSIYEPLSNSMEVSIHSLLKLRERRDGKNEMRKERDVWEVPCRTLKLSVYFGSCSCGCVGKEETLLLVCMELLSCVLISVLETHPKQLVGH